MKTITLGGAELNGRDLDAISEMVAEALQNRGLDVTSFSWSIEVDYQEVNDETPP